MPRLVNTHPNEQSDAFPLDRIDQIILPSEMERLLPPDLPESQKEGFLDDIRYAFGEFKWEQEDGPNRYTRAEASASIRELLNTQAIDRNAMRALNQRAFNLVYDMAPDLTTQLWMFGATRDCLSTDQVHSAAQRALDFLIKQVGPEKPFALFVLVQKLCRVYEAAFELPVKHHTKVTHGAYSQDAQTKAGKFVTAAIQMLHPEIANTKINRCLRDYVRHRPYCHKGTDSSEL